MSLYETKRVFTTQREHDIFVDANDRIFAVKVAAAHPDLTEGLKKALEILAAKTSATSCDAGGERDNWGFKSTSFGISTQKEVR